MLAINTNLSSLIAQSSMKTSTNKLNQAIERMTTGYKINHASDNAANYSISTNMTTKLNAYNVASDNVAMGMDLVTTASDTVSLMQDKAQRLRALCTQARNGTYGGKSLDAINTEANAIISEINRIYSTAQYNGVSLFTGGNNSAETAAAAPAAMFAMPRTMPVAETEGGFISDPVTYTDEEVAAMTTITQAVAEGSLVSGGTYSISTVDELVALADYVNSGNSTTGMTFVLGADIDLSSIANWTPIGDYSTNSNYTFAGTFDGNGHVIKNLTIDNETTDYQGLFGYTKSGSKIKNVGLEGGSVKGKESVGGLVGYSSSSITNSYATGTVTGAGYYVGGLVGLAEGASITNSYATGTVTGTREYVGGLVGRSTASPITNSYATGTVTGTRGFVGGLVGRAYCSITNSYATGTVTGTRDYVGGLVGDSDSSITNSYATGTVNGGSNVGGLVAYSTSSITNSYATGTVTGTSDYVGGLVGRAPSSSSITNSYATGTVTGTGSSVGGLVGKSSSSSSISNCASVQSDSKATQMTEEEIKATYTPESMGFTEANGWTIVDGVPVIKVQYTRTPTPPSGGGGANAGAFLLQVGINSDSSCQIGFDINFSYDLSIVGADIASDEALSAIDDFINQLSKHETKLGAVQNRLESALESIMVNIDNLTSSRSTIRDADIAEVSSHYIQQQILQQASATLLATANQSPSIALQLI